MFPFHAIKSCSLVWSVVSSVQKVASVSNHGRDIVVHKSFSKFHMYRLLAYQSYSSTAPQHERLSWEVSPRAVLLRKLESALNDHQLDEAWVNFNGFKSLYGFPPDALISKLVTELSYSADPCWLQRAYNLAVLICEGKSKKLLQVDILTKLSLSLARAQMPIPASGILRLMLDRRILPQMNVLWLVLFHMVKTDPGTYLASNFLIQICDCFLDSNAKKYQQVKLVKPDTMTFNIILDGCVRFKSSLKGQQVMELMAEIGVTADAHSITLIGQIHEMNGLRDEIKKLKYHIDGLPVPFLCHYQQLCNSLLNLHFKFDDIDAAAKLILDMHITPVSATLHEKCRRELQKPHLVSIGSDSIRSGLKMQILPELLVKDSILQSQTELDLVDFKNGKILLKKRAMAKLVGGCRKHGRISELSEVLHSIQEDCHKQEGSSLCSEVIEACVHVGWLETAHDILDDMEKLGGRSMSLTTYITLLKAYYGKQMLKQGNALLRRMQKLGWLVDASNEVVAFSCASEKSDLAHISSKCRSGLAECLLQEAGEEKGMSPTVYELNSTIYFFCKAKMMEDALKTYRKMGHMQIRPTVQTFAHLVHGYSSLGMYRDITILWGDIKRNVEKSNLALCRDMYECLLLNFLRGGYFERVMEIVDCMRKQNMYADRWMYRCEFLKLHKNLYKSLKASEARNDTQKKRLQHVAAFRKWAGVV
ncbi:unnamed protein product [Linum trigynum]|uniref:At1g68980-like TPR repeats domain-containing protein n=1 Tax=Linum trigynum TaxID=586398 RepID=A0AAV2DIR2_9ROSI